MKKIYVIVIVVVAILIIIFSCFFYMSKPSNKKQQNVLQNNGQQMIINDKSTDTNMAIESNESSLNPQIANHMGQVSDPVITQDAPEDDGTLLLQGQK